MVTAKTYFTIAIVSFAFISSFAQRDSHSVHASSSSISLKKSELSKVKEEISSLEKELKYKAAKEKESYNTLDNYNKQSYLLHNLINNLKSDEADMDQQISVSQNNIEELKNETNLLKMNYSKYIVAVFKHGKPDYWASVLDANSLEQAILRYKYLKKFAYQRERDLERLQNKKDDLISAKQDLETERNEKTLLANQKADEEKMLDVKREARKKILNSIRNDKAALISELDAKKNAEIKIQNMISKLIVESELRRKAEEERLEKERLKARSKKLVSKSNIEKPDLSDENKYDIDLSTSGLPSFASLKGRLNWPVSGGKIIRNFGENKNEKLNTVTLNYGVDIKTFTDADVRSVADGIVSAIDWLPGYGSVLILTHKGDYRTVYSHLSEIFVKEGNHVNSGSVIGKVGESLEGNILHFEIWNSRRNQNPENWLERKN
ncbi:MAG: peptidoglycan DD-metalloendopeptidase family protein [Ignavibacteriaceae bacterium]